jgi:beta-lactamase class C
VRGYRSLISFDPMAKVGIAVLWNSESTRPVAIPMELWDMVAGRPAKDWMHLDDGKKPN